MARIHRLITVAIQSLNRPAPTNIGRQRWLSEGPELVVKIADVMKLESDTAAPEIT